MQTKGECPRNMEEICTFIVTQSLHPVNMNRGILCNAGNVGQNCRITLNFVICVGQKLPSP